LFGTKKIKIILPPTNISADCGSGWMRSHVFSFSR